MIPISTRILLHDRTPTGLRYGEILNWTGQAIACSRNKIEQLDDYTKESQRPGIYFLFYKHSTNDKNRVYIGETENVYKRLFDHKRGKDFWSEFIFFTSKDENLTKAHIKYIESRLTEITKQYNKYSLENSNTPTKSRLPRGDIAAMEEFINNIKILIEPLGHKFLTK